MTWSAQPAEKKADQLPHRIQTQATRHNRITLKMAAEKPKIGRDIQFRLDTSLAVLATTVRDMADAVEHQHGRQRQLCVAGPEQFTAPALQQFLAIIAIFFVHKNHSVEEYSLPASWSRRAVKPAEATWGNSG